MVRRLVGIVGQVGIAALQSLRLSFPFYPYIP